MPLSILTPLLCSTDLFVKFDVLGKHQINYFFSIQNSGSILHELTKTFIWYPTNFYESIASLGSIYIEQDMMYLIYLYQSSYQIKSIAPIHSSANHANHLHWMQIVLGQTAQFGSKAANMLIIGAQAKCPKTARRHS